MYDPNSQLSYRKIFDIIESSDSNFVMVGTMNNGSSANTNYIDSAFITRLTKDGDIIWSKKARNTNLVNSFNRVIELPNQDYIIANLLLNYNDTVQITRLTKDGNIIWSKNYSNPNSFDFQGLDIKITNDNNLLIWVFDGNVNGGVFIKIDLNGNILWAKSYDYNFNSSSSTDFSGRAKNQVTEDGDGFTAVFIYVPIINGKTVCQLLKVDKNDGHPIWFKSLRSSMNNILGTDIRTTNIGLQVMAKIDSQWAGRYLSFINLNNEGNLINCFRVINKELIGGFVINNPNKTIFAATDNSNNTSTTAPTYLFQTNNNGLFEWGKRYDIPSTALPSVWAPSIIQSKDSGFASVVNRTGNTANGLYSSILKTDLTGGSANCPSNNIELNIDFPQINVYELVVNQVQDVVLNITPASFKFVDENLQVDTICSSTQFCNLVKLVGVDTICSIHDSINYSIKRNPECSTTAIWQLSDTSFGKIAIVNDSIAKIKFTKPGLVTLRAILPTPCATVQDSMEIHIIISPDSIALGPDIEICKSNIYILQAGAGFKSYLWQDGSTSSAYTVSGPGKYFVEAKDYCNNPFSDTLLVAQTPDTTIGLGPNFTKCNKDTISILPPQGLGLYSWKPNYNIDTSNPLSVKLFPDLDTSYILSVQHSIACTLSDTIWVKVNHSPSIYLGSDTSFCVGDSLLLDAGEGFVSYTWNTGASSQQIIVDKQGLYSVAATALNQCISTDSLLVQSIFSLPVVAFGKDSFICKNSFLILNPGNDFSSYLWQDGSTNATITITQPGKYSVKVTDANGCSSLDSIILNYRDCISSIYFPNAFTPNGDGKNDVFRPIVHGVLDKYFLAIYNRYGQKIFQTNDPTKGWDGYYNGASQGTNTFVWMSSYRFQGSNEEKAEKGILILIY